MFALGTSFKAHLNNLQIKPYGPLSKSHFFGQSANTMEAHEPPWSRSCLLMQREQLKLISEETEVLLCTDTLH
jgi:hypothetical protein